MRRLSAAAILILALLFVSVFSVSRSFAITQSAGATQPAGIKLTAERSHVYMDDYDNVKITAYVQDAQGNPVADGTRVNFTIGDATSNAFMGGFTWSIYNGSFSTSPGSCTFTNLTSGGMGSASAFFGWIPNGSENVNSTIWAYVNGTNIYATIKIYFTTPMGGWTGYVVDSSGKSYGGISVTLHVMGSDRNGTYEIYNMTRITSSSPSSLGQFSFDYIVLNSGTYTPYAYVDARAKLDGNRTVYGRSDNISMNGSTMSFGPVVLDMPDSTSTPMPTSTTTLPTAAPPANNGVTIGLSIVILLAIILGAGAYYLYRKK